MSDAIVRDVAEPCEICKKKVFLGKEIEYELDVFWVCLTDNAKIEKLKAIEFKREVPKLLKLHVKRLVDLKAKLIKEKIK